MKEGVAFAAFFVVFAGLLGLAFWAMDRSDAASAKYAKQITYRANHYCDKSGGLKDIEHHGASWSFGPYIKVRCGNGRLGVIQ